MRGILAALTWAGYLGGLFVAWWLPASDLIRFRILVGVLLFVMGVGLNYTWGRIYLTSSRQNGGQTH